MHVLLGCVRTHKYESLMQERPDFTLWLALKVLASVRQQVSTATLGYLTHVRDHIMSPRNGLAKKDAINFIISRYFSKLIHGDLA